MTNTIKIGASEKELSEATESWITQSINDRRRDGVSVCVQISLHTGAVRMTLSTPNCSSATGPGRPPNEAEAEIFRLWEKLGLRDAQFAPGNVVAFVKQVQRSYLQ